MFKLTEVISMEKETPDLLIETLLDECMYIKFYKNYTVIFTLSGICSRIAANVLN
jgi:hypothetical protein